MLLRLQRGVWSMVKWLRQATNEYPPPPRLVWEKIGSEKSSQGVCHLYVLFGAIFITRHDCNGLVLLSCFSRNTVHPVGRISKVI